MNMFRKTTLSLLAAAVIAPALSACSPGGILLGAGTLLGIASVREGGISGTLSDAEIKALINDKWFQYNVDTFRKLSTTVDQGRVLVTGVVQDPEDRVEAVRLAWQVEGVKQVINEIRVADSDGVKGFVNDTWISTRLRAALTVDREVQNLNYSIDTVQGTVYLMGVAQTQSELNRVIEIARNIPHVRRVVSYIKLPGEE